MSYRAHLNRARRLDLPLAWRLSSFRSCLVCSMWLVRRHQVLPKDWYEKELLEFYSEFFRISAACHKDSKLLMSAILLSEAIQDLDKRRDNYLIHIQVYQKRRIREKMKGIRMGSCVAWPYNGFLPDDWLQRS